MTTFERRANDVDVGLLVVCETEENTSAVPVERNKDTLDIMRGERQGTKGERTKKKRTKGVKAVQLFCTGKIYFADSWRRGGTRPIEPNSLLP